MVRTVAVVGLVGLAAGCSSDTVRFDDGFYTGAVPKAPLAQAAATQPYPGSVDATTTGSVGQPQGGDGQFRAPTGTVQSGQLPPPPAPNYSQSRPTGVQTAQATPSRSYEAVQTVQAAPKRDRTVSNGYDNARPVTRGAPPTTLQAQAAHISVPQSRPTYTASSTSSVASPGRSSNVTEVKVESGDTLLGIARRTGVSTADIKRANAMSDNTIRLGQTLTIPGAGSGSTRVASLETKTASEPVQLSEPAKKAPEPYTAPKPAEASPVPSSNMAEKSSRPAADAPSVPVQVAPSTSVGKEVQRDVAAVAPDSTGIDGFRWPVQGRVVNRFGEKVGSRRNDGLNISVPRGTPVKAAENGVVIYAGDGLKEFGNTVLIKHDDGLVTVYGHAETLEVQKGAKVRRGQEIAKSGMSGDTDVPLLHFEVRKNSSPVDPTKFLQ